MTVRLGSRQLKTKFGEFTEHLYYDGQKESIALVMGEVRGNEAVLCRIHSACVGGHVFNSIECTCQAEMDDAQQRISEAGRGVIVYLEQEGKGNGHLALIESIRFKVQGRSQAEAYRLAGYREDARDYSPAAKILVDLGVASVELLTDNPAKIEELRTLGITVI